MSPSYHRTGYVNQGLAISSHPRIFPTAIPLVFLLISVVVFESATFLTEASSISIRPGRVSRMVPSRLLKKSEIPQWEELGWAWGKRSAPLPESHSISYRSDGSSGRSNIRSLQSKEAPDWQDLGWAWGR